MLIEREVPGEITDTYENVRHIFYKLKFCEYLVHVYNMLHLEFIDFMAMIMICTTIKG